MRAIRSIARLHIPSTGIRGSRLAMAASRDALAETKEGAFVRTDSTLRGFVGPEGPFLPESTEPARQITEYNMR